MEDFFGKFAHTLSKCKKKKVLEGALPLLTELKKRNEGLWSFEGEEVVFQAPSGKVRENFEQRGEFYKCYRELVERCKEVCIFEIHSMPTACCLKKTVAVSSEYYNLDYKVFWEYMKKEELFS
uniref:Uncharacterized protein n=1 Tax=Marseillevirus sp. TaxID=2809551 RepID=A0AA96IYB0_9VIRU|nr:hypothetical protein MarFTMF_510 [Marseillevirus sp.]